MVTVTDQAAAVLHDTIKASDVPEGNALRLSTGPEGFALTVDSPGPEDHVIWHEEVPVLLIEPTVDTTLGQAVIEVDEGLGPEGAKLVIRHAE